VLKPIFVIGLPFDYLLPMLAAATMALIVGLFVMGKLASAPHSNGPGGC
jgi:hypothetical protein